MPSKEEFIAALEEELKGYELYGKTERAAEVKKELEKLVGKKEKPAAKKKKSE